MTDKVFDFQDKKIVDINALNSFLGKMREETASTYINNENVVTNEEVDSIFDGGDDNTPTTPTSKISLCDIAYWDGSAVKTVSKDNWDASLGTPIGVVVIPSGILPDGKARMISLKTLHRSGSKWGTNGLETTDTPLTNYAGLPMMTDNTGNTATNLGTWCWLPMDEEFDGGVPSYVDIEAKYDPDAVNYARFVPSPYLYNGGELALNPEYCKAIEGGNAFSDFNGLSNTEILAGLGEWDNANYWTAAQWAWKYSDGVSDTQWYLPAMGELGFLLPRMNKINSTIRSVGGEAIGDKFGNSVSKFVWSSTERDAEHNFRVSTDGYATSELKRNSCHGWAFALVP